MEFANAAGDETHLDAGHGLGDGEFAEGDLAGPAAGVDALMGSAKEYLKGWTVPLSVSGGQTELGFSASTGGCWGRAAARWGGGGRADRDRRTRLLRSSLNGLENRYRCGRRQCGATGRKEPPACSDARGL